MSEEDSNTTSGRNAEFDEFGRSQEVSQWRKLEFAELSRAQRAVCYELIRRGDISWFLHPAQAKLLAWIDANPHDELCICICRQFGKSFMLLAYCIALCIKNAGYQVMFIAPTRDQVRKIILPRIAHVFAYLPDDLLPARNGLTWTFAHNGSVFTLEGVNIGGGARLRGGMTPNLVVMDECRDIPHLQDVIESAITPMFTTTAGKLILVSTPPASPLHSFTDKYIREALRDGSFYSATYKDNALLGGKMLRRLFKRYPGGEDHPVFRREYLCDYNVSDPSKRVVREWDSDGNNTWFLTYRGPCDGQGQPIMVRPYVFMDYGFGDPCGLLFGYFDWYEGALIIQGEHFERGMNTDDVAKKIIEMEGEHHGKLVKREETLRIMDIDPSMMADLRARYNLKFSPYPRTANDLQMLGRLRLAFVEEKIRVHPRCTQLTFQLQAGVFNDKHTDYLRTDRGGHLDLIDALKYGQLATRWNEVLHGRTMSGLAHNQIQVGVNPFASRTGGFGGNVISRPS